MYNTTSVHETGRTVLRINAIDATIAVGRYAIMVVIIAVMVVIGEKGVAASGMVGLPIGRHLSI